MSAGVALVATILHFTGAFPGNTLAWAAWILAVAAYLGSFGGRAAVRWRGFHTFARSEPGIALLVAVLYAPTHLWNYATAPWNNFGLFDDAAWDVYFARNHAFTGPFQAAFFDEVGLISRETVFHYYITAFFRLFGYNLLVFNIALAMLGFATVLFTTLVVHRLFRKPLVTALAALMINFLPLYYLHVYVGHRYAIAAPLMMAALYFVYSGFQDRSYPRVGLSALFAALCFGSAIMGKQFIVAFAVAGLLVPVLERRRWRMPETRGLWLAWVVAFLISAIPLLTYIAFNREDYFRRDQGLLSDFLAAFAASGYSGVEVYFQGTFELFFAGDTYSRLWLHDYPLVPLAYWLLLIPGAALALLRGRIELLLLAVIPVGSAFLSGPTDFRVLLGAPIWIVLMAYTLDWLVPRRLIAAPASRALSPSRLVLAGLAVVVVIAGVLPSAAYLWRVSTEPQAQYLLRHRDVAVSRVIQDVIAGSDQPSPELKGDEFNRSQTAVSQHTDALVCPEQAYAVAHLYLQSFRDRDALAFCDGGNQALLGPVGVLPANLKALSSYQPRGKDLALIWEESDLARPAIEAFAPFEHFGVTRTYKGSVDGQAYGVRVLSIPAARVAAFRDAVLGAISGGGLVTTRELGTLLAVYAVTLLAATVVWVVLFHTPLLSGSVFFYRGLVLLALVGFVAATVLFVLRQTVLRGLLGIRDILLVLSLLLSVNVVFFTHLPVTADRSISVFMLAWMNRADNPLTADEIEQGIVQEYVIDREAIAKRLEEQLVTGTVVPSGEGYVLSDEGRSLVALYELIARLFNIDTDNLSP